MVGRSPGSTLLPPYAGYQPGSPYPGGTSKNLRPWVKTSVTIPGSTMRGRKSVASIHW